MRTGIQAFTARFRALSTGPRLLLSHGTNYFSYWNPADVLCMGHIVSLNLSRRWIFVSIFFLSALEVLHIFKMHSTEKTWWEAQTAIMDLGVRHANSDQREMLSELLKEGFSCLGSHWQAWATCEHLTGID